MKRPSPATELEDPRFLLGAACADELPLPDAYSEPFLEDHLEDVGAARVEADRALDPELGLVDEAEALLALGQRDSVTRNSSSPNARTSSRWFS
jgi:hypothetical protein